MSSSSIEDRFQNEIILNSLNCSSVDGILIRTPIRNECCCFFNNFNFNFIKLKKVI